MFAVQWDEKNRQNYWKETRLNINLKLGTQVASALAPGPAEENLESFYKNFNNNKIVLKYFFLSFQNLKTHILVWKKPILGLLSLFTHFIKMQAFGSTPHTFEKSLHKI